MFGIINMNGRLYDPAVGRFFSPDNYVQLPDNPQSYNRYSYCLNNPLKYTDPSGENIFAILYSIYSIAHQTYASYCNYGREAGLNTLISSIAFTAAGYIVGSAIGETINGNLENSGGKNSINAYLDANGKFYGECVVTATRLPESTEAIILSFSKGFGMGAMNVLGNMISAPIKALWDHNYIENTFKDASTGIKTLVTTNPIETAKAFYNKAINMSAKEWGEFTGEAATGAAIPSIGTIKYLSQITKVEKIINNVCFPENTLVLTKDGLVPIQNLQIGDSLWTYNTESEQIEFAVVENIFERKANNFVKLHFENDSVTCTPEHPFYVDNDWVQAKELQAGDLLLNANGKSVSVTSVLQYSTDTATTVYNLEASGNHNFYVSASGVLVHNKANIVGKIKEFLPKGFKETKEFGFPHGQKVYKKGNLYYSKDIDGHNGESCWKVFERVGTKLKRIGTAKDDLKIFKK